MTKRRLGGSALEVSVVSLGGNNFGGRVDFAASSRVVGKALELGINLIDTADSYGDKGGSEEWLGRSLGEKRKAIVLASKFGMRMDETGELKGASRRYIMHAVEASMKRLRTDWIDLYQLHRPDPQTPIEETLRALIPTAKALGLGILPYFPLASGLLTGKYKHGAALSPGSRLAKNPRHAQEFITERNWRIVGELETFAARRGHTMLELAFSWLLRDGVVASVIAGATAPEQVEQNVRAAGWTLSGQDLAEIDRLTL